MKAFRIFLIVSFCLLFGASESFAQCGADGLQACNSGGTSSVKKQSKPKVIPVKPVTTGRKNKAVANNKNKAVVKPPVTPAKDADYYFDYALNTCGATDYDCRIINYSKAIQLGGGAGAYNNRCHSYEKKGLYGLAIIDCTKAIELNPNNAATYNIRAVIYTKKQDYDQAIRDYTRAIELKPDYANAYGGRAYSYDKIQNYEQAVKDYTRVIELKPDYADAYYNRAIAYRRLGKTSLAEADERKVEELENK